MLQSREIWGHCQDDLDSESDLRMRSMVQCTKMRNRGRVDSELLGELNGWDCEGDAEWRPKSVKLKASLKYAHEAQHETHCHIA